MSPAASELTLGANHVPMILASVVRGTVELAGAVGVDRSTLLERMRVTEDELARPEHFVPLEAQLVGFEAIGALPSAATLGIELARSMTPDLLGVVGFAMANAPTGRDVVECFRRYNAVFGDPHAPEIDVGDTTVKIHQVWDDRSAKTRVMPEFTLAATVALLRDLLGLASDDPLVSSVSFQHACGADTSVHDGFFGAPIRWSASETSIVLVRSALERPVLRRSASLYEHLDSHTRALAPPAPERSSLADRVRGRIADSLKHGEPSPASVARALGTSERTLQRRLKSEGRTFADILEGTRRELATRYLADAQLAVYEIAFLLGYSETSSFHRAFKRWTGEGPQEHRVRLRSNG